MEQLVKKSVLKMLREKAQDPEFDITSFNIKQKEIEDQIRLNLLDQLVSNPEQYEKVVTLQQNQNEKKLASISTYSKYTYLFKHQIDRNLIVLIQQYIKGYLHTYEYEKVLTADLTPEPEFNSYNDVVTKFRQLGLNNNLVNFKFIIEYLEELLSNPDKKMHGLLQAIYKILDSGDEADIEFLSELVNNIHC